MKYEIPECNIESLEKKIVRIRNKCKKYGCEFKYERIGEHIEEIAYKDDEGKEHKVPVKFIDVDCEGVAKVDGWQFAASLEHTAKGNIISAVPGIEIPTRYYKCDPWCEHCKTNRDRRLSYIVLSDDGEFKQVGKSCLKDFTGGLSAEWAAQVESFFKEVEEASEFSGFGGWAKRYFKTEDFMVYCAEIIRLYGFAKNEWGTKSTSSRASDCYEVENGFPLGLARDSIMADYDEAVARGFDSKNADSVALAKTVREWIAQTTTDTNYFNNLRVACALDWVGYDKLGLLASAFPAHDKELEIQAEKAEREAKQKAEGMRSKHVGEVGKRVSFVPAEVKCVTSWETMYGETSIYKMTDVDGNVFTWKTSGGIYEGPRQVAVKITGTVKEHKEYRGVKQTELTRCKVEYGKREERKPTDEELKASEEAQKDIAEALDMLYEDYKEVS